MSFTMGFCYVHHLSPTELLDYSFNPYPGGFMANMTSKHITAVTSLLFIQKNLN